MKRRKRKCSYQSAFLSYISSFFPRLLLGVSEKRKTNLRGSTATRTSCSYQPVRARQLLTRGREHAPDVITHRKQAVGLFIPVARAWRRLLACLI